MSSMSTEWSQVGDRLLQLCHRWWKSVTHGPPRAKHDVSMSARLWIFIIVIITTIIDGGDDDIKIFTQYIRALHMHTSPHHTPVGYVNVHSIYMYIACTCTCTCTCTFYVHVGYVHHVGYAIRSSKIHRWLIGLETAKFSLREKWTNCPHSY